MDLTILPSLSKDYILQRISQEEIMSYYLQVPIDLNNLIVCPPIVRQDTNPTFGFYYNSQGRLRGRDLGQGAFWGDCFDAVALAIKTDGSTRKGFNLILHTIAKDFRIHKYKDSKEVSKYDKITAKYFEKTKQKHKKKIIFNIVFRELNYHDTAYWSKFNIKPPLLKEGRVFCAQEIYMSYDGEDFNLIYKYNPKDPAYCYYGGRDINRIINWKIYYPYRKKGEQRFHSNSSFLQGKHLITCGRVGGIIKAYKDVLSMRNFGIQSVAPSAESVLLNNEDYFFMKTKFDYLFSCMDYDKAGLTMAIKLRNTYGITPIMFTPKFTVKDFAEYVDKFKIKQTTKLLTDIFDTYKDDLYKLDKYYYDVLKHIK